VIDVLTRVRVQRDLRIDVFDLGVVIRGFHGCGSLMLVIPATAGIQHFAPLPQDLDPGFRRDDERRSVVTT
jgi:hypothetical protein